MKSFSKWGTLLVALALGDHAGLGAGCQESCTAEARTEPVRSRVGILE